MEVQLKRGSALLLLKLSSAIILYAVLLTSIYDHFGIRLNAEIPDWSPVTKFFVTIILAPLIETWLCQYLPFRLVIRFLKIQNTIQFKYGYILITSLLFSVMHNNSVWFMIYAFIPGLIMSYCFLSIYKKYSSYSNAFWHTAVLHSIVNTAIFMLENILSKS